MSALLAPGHPFRTSFECGSLVQASPWEEGGGGSAFYRLPPTAGRRRRRCPNLLALDLALPSLPVSKTQVLKREEPWLSGGTW